MGSFFRSEGGDPEGGGGGQRGRRRIRSFVLRPGRMTPAQARAIDADWPVFGIDRRGGTLDLHRIFGRRAPRVLEIGAGMGEVVHELARRHPENDYVAVEVHPPGIGALLKKIRQSGLANIRLVREDVMDLLETGFAPGSFGQVHLFFPDPWPKKRHHKRRLLQARTLARLKPCLREDARFYLATDRADLAAHILAVMEEDADFINLAGAGAFAPRPHWRPISKFEGRGLKQGRRIFDFAYAFRPEAVPPTRGGPRP